MLNHTWNNDEIVPVLQSIYLYNVLGGKKQLDNFMCWSWLLRGRSLDRMALTFVDWFDKILK